MQANAVSFTNFACDEYDGAYFDIIFKWEDGYEENQGISTNSSAFSRFMHVVPEKDNREKATSVSYEVAGQPSKNCYNLAKYDGSKHTSTEEEYYRKFRYNDWGGRRCPVCYPGEQYSDSDSESDDSEIDDSELKDLVLNESKNTKNESTNPPDDSNEAEITLQKEMLDLALNKGSPTSMDPTSTISTSTEIQTVTLPQLARTMSPTNTHFSSCCTN